MASPEEQHWQLSPKRERTYHAGQQDTRSRQSCDNDGYLRSRTEGRLRASTSGYGEVSAATMRLGAKVTACQNYGN